MAYRHSIKNPRFRFPAQSLSTNPVEVIATGQAGARRRKQALDACVTQP
jgi:hypothetical protein